MGMTWREEVAIKVWKFRCVGEDVATLDSVKDRIRGKSTVENWVMGFGLSTLALIYLFIKFLKF